MKTSSIVLILVMLSLQLHSVVSTCSQLYPITLTPNSFATCGANKVLTPADFPNFPAAGTKQLFFTYTFERSTTFCAADTNGFGLAVTVNVGGTEKFLFGVKPTSTHLYVQRMNDAGVLANSLSSTWNSMGDVKVRFAFWIDLAETTTSNILYCAYVKAGSLYATPLTFGYSSYSDFLFDSNTKIYLNSGHTGVSSVPQTIYDFAVGYQIPVPPGANVYSMLLVLFDKMFTTTTATELIASYDTSRLSGYTIPDSTRLGTAYLGETSSSSSDTTNSPTQDSTGALSFTSTSQKVTLPSTVYTGDLGFSFVYSMTVSFTIKISAYPSDAAQTIVSRTRPNGDEVFSIKLGTDGKITGSLSGVAFLSTITALPMNAWTLVTVYIAAFDAGSEIMAASVISYGSTAVTIPPPYPGFAETIPTLRRDEATDILKIGGFTGLLSHFTLGYRGQGLVEDGSCLTDCKYMRGPYTNVCVMSTCSTTSQYADGDRCANCDVACSGCSGSGSTSCIGCNSAAGYGFSAPNTCSACNPGDYYNSGVGCSSCAAAIERCSECSTSTTCTRCSSPYVLGSGGASCVCPSGTTDTGSECRANEVVESGLSTGAIIGIVLGSIGLLVLAGLGLRLLKRKNRSIFRKPTTATQIKPTARLESASKIELNAPIESASIQLEAPEPNTVGISVSHR